MRKSICAPKLQKMWMDGRKLVNWYDWKSYFSTLYKTIPSITTYHHFRFDKKSPGIAFVRTLADSPELVVTIFSENARHSQASTQSNSKGIGPKTSVVFV